MTSVDTTAEFSGHGNRGFQLGFNSGYVHVNFHGQPAPTKPNPSSTVPFRRDSDFIDRDILAEISEKCSKPASRAALVGLGGVGKSQIAIEYSYRIREQFPQTWIFWVHASNAARFEEGYRIIADRIKLPRQDETATSILQSVSNWLCDEANGQWIMIIDNADDHAVFSDPRKGILQSDVGDFSGEVLLSAFLPQSPNGSILVTSRSQEAALRLTGSCHDIIKVEPMDEGRALLLLEKKLRREFDKKDAIELLRALDYMPLAISQAAAYICQRTPWTTVGRYLDDFRKSDRRQAKLLNSDIGDLRRDVKASNSIINTWQISFDYIRCKRPSAARLLSLMSIFDRQGIPKFLLHRHEIDRSDTDMKDNAGLDLDDDNDREFEDDVFTLTSYSLITTNVKCDQFEMHRLVQVSTRKWLELNSELEKWRESYIKIMWEAFPRGDYENWTLCQVLFPHAEAMLAFRPSGREYLVYWSDVLHNAGWYARTQGNYVKAEVMNRQALEVKRKALGEDHPDMLTSVISLALALQNQGKYEAAEGLNRQALDGYEKAFGKEHSDTLTSVNNLASVLLSQGKYEAAEELHRRALDGYERALGKDHPNTLTSVNNLASTLQHQGKYEAAEETNRRALEGSKKMLGKEHPITLTSINILASVLQDQEKYEAAEEMNRQALEGREKVLGKEHPDTLTSLSDLAAVLHYQGKYKAAEEMSQRSLKGNEKALGKEHPGTLVIVSNLAAVLQHQGKYEAAEEMNQRALDGREKALGKEHPDTLTSVSNLALVLQHRGKYEAAEDMNRRALDEREKALGREHPDTLTSLSNLALVLQHQGKYESAEEMNRRALVGREKALGKEHPETLMTVGNLATVLQDQGKYEAAEKMSRRALEGREKTLGEEHRDTLTSVNNLALVLQHQGKYEAAEEMNRRALDGSEKALGKVHPDTLMTVRNLALVLQYRGKYQAAEDMNRRALVEQEKALGKEHPSTLMSVVSLAAVLQDQGKYEAAEEMNRRALDGREKALGKEHPDTLTSVHWLAYLLHQQKQYEDATTLYERSRTGFQKVLGIDHPKTRACSDHYSSMIEEMEGQSRSKRRKIAETNAI